MKKAIILLSIITSVVFIGVVILLFKSPIPSEKDVLKIEILNGTTGDSIIFTTNEKDEILKKFRTLKTRVSGIASWSCGYTYKVTFIMKEQKKHPATLT